MIGPILSRNGAGRRTTRRERSLLGELARGVRAGPPWGEPLGPGALLLWELARARGGTRCAALRWRYRPTVGAVSSRTWWFAGASGRTAGALRRHAAGTLLLGELTRAIRRTGWLLTRVRDRPWPFALRRTLRIRGAVAGGWLGRTRSGSWALSSGHVRSRAVPGRRRFRAIARLTRRHGRAGAAMCRGRRRCAGVGGSRPVAGLFDGSVAATTRILGRKFGAGDTRMTRCAGLAGSGMTRHRMRIDGRITGSDRRTAVSGRDELRSMTSRARAPIHVRHGLVAIGVLPGRHPTFPRSAGGPAQGRVVVVVAPMSGIIVAHHASCTRRNPRIPPVR
ncbi:hypothetical protein ASD42_26110 [Nocardia sp. Root136]|nr:hypothetical protein ASD42_26110 [Nocardia sp. Root136]